MHQLQGRLKVEVPQPLSRNSIIKQQETVLQQSISILTVKPTIEDIVYHN